VFALGHADTNGLAAFGLSRTNLNDSGLVCVPYAHLAKKSFDLLKHHVSPIVYTNLLLPYSFSSFYTLHSLTPLLL